jgi:hypothetical protein
MSEQPAIKWVDANQQCLSARLAVVQSALVRCAARVKAEETAPDSDAPALEHALEQAHEALPAPAALDLVCDAFRLSPFERDILLLCAGVELDSSFGRLCGSAQGNSQHTFATFSLALAALPDAHWSALSPGSPLRRWRLIEVSAGDTLTNSPLRIDETVLHYLAGVSHLDSRLEGLVEPVGMPQSLASSQREIAGQIIALWEQSKAGAEFRSIELCGDDARGNSAVAASACAASGLGLLRMSAADAPASAVEREALARVWEREAALSRSALLLDFGESEPSHAALAFLAGVRGIVFVSTRDPLRQARRPIVRFDVKRPTNSEQIELWRESLESSNCELNGGIEELVSQFNLSGDAICAISAEVLRAPGRDRLEEQLWEACRRQSRERLDDLAQRIEPAAGWDDLVLPEGQLVMLREIAAQVRNRAQVYEKWGFAEKGKRGLGISALFAGPSGTGKTMAAEVLAGELRLDLYRIDLSQVVSKYIGETEKNLRRVFDAAEQGGAILLFDEADAIFGKRTEVKDSHDRYANIEVSYLLQRMEAYRGLAILTTNMKAALDTAFMRRLRFVVQFPFPNTAQRSDIWRAMFPKATRTSAIDYTKLARLNISGGNIRNIALHAAFLAADVSEPVRMKHLLRAARSEYAKLEKPLTDAETSGWM